MRNFTAGGMLASTLSGKISARFRVVIQQAVEPQTSLAIGVKRILKSLTPYKWRYEARKRFVLMSIRHLYGPKSVRLSSNEAVVTCVVRNGEHYIESFIRHYSQMGFRHIFLLDNGSSDQTIPLAKRHKNVSICQSTLSIEANQGIFKRYLAQHSAEGGWCLDADIDEFFDYPYSNIILLNEFIEYLNRNGFTAVVTHMLDMFSDRPIVELEKNRQEEDLRTVYPYFDISEITMTRYRESEVASRYGNRNTLSNEGAELYEGGIRKTLCGIKVLLTKHSLFLPAKELELFPHVHFQNNARLADLSCVLLHYKLTRNALASALQNRERMPGLRWCYDAIIRYVTEQSAHQIKRHTAMKFRSTSDLVDCGFLFVSEGYREYVKAISARQLVAVPYSSKDDAR